MKEISYASLAQEYLRDVASKVEDADDLKDLKDAISSFYMKKSDRIFNSLWDAGTLDQEKLNELRGQHLRTPYSR